MVHKWHRLGGTPSRRRRKRGMELELTIGTPTAIAPLGSAEAKLRIKKDTEE